MATDFQAGLLNKKWMHSHEEDHDHEIVYRPSTYKFPLSRGRTSFEMEVGGILKIGGPAPDDRHQNKKSVWEIEENILVFRHANSVLRKFRILSLNSDKLVVEDLI
jgi:hypothetical protein